MKIKIITICLILFTPQVFASCDKDIDVSTEISHQVFVFHYKNKTDKQIVVYEIGITKGNSNKVVKKKERKTMLKPYGISLDVLKFNDINPDIIVEPYYRCRYANILDKLFKEKLYKIPN